MTVATVQICQEYLKYREEWYKKNKYFKPIWENTSDPYRKQGNRLILEEKLCIP